MENLNHKYWEEMTVKSTLSYCKEMLRLSGNPYEKVSEEDFDQRCKAYVRKVIEYDRAKTLKEHLDELYELSPFPEDIRGYLHEYSRDRIFQPKHLMCKLATIRVPDITFEFLIEYGILESDVEIYYGIKAISDDTETTDDFAIKVMDLSDIWFEYIKNLTKERGRTAGFCQRHKFTNNVHDGTFWISWVRMESKDTLEDVIRDLDKNIFNKFSTFLLKSQNEYWHQVEESACSFSDISKILDNRNADAQFEDKHTDLIPTLEKFCQFRDRNKEDGEPILKKTDTGHYQFSCDSVTARVFIELLFNEVYFRNSYERVEQYKSLSIAKRSKDYQNSFKKYVEEKTLHYNSLSIAERKKDENKIWASQIKRPIDRVWVLKTFRNREGGSFPQSFFNRTVKYDDLADYKKVKALLEK